MPQSSFILFCLGIWMSLALLVRGDGSFASIFLLLTWLYIYTQRSAQYWVTLSSKKCAYPCEFRDPLPKPILLSFPQKNKAKKEAQKKNRETPKGSKREEQKRTSFRKPCFRGVPYEVLGIDPDAKSNVIQAAHRFWLHKYHPDHSPDAHTRTRGVRNQQTQMLNQAKKEMMRMRKRVA